MPNKNPVKFTLSEYVAYIIGDFNGKMDTPFGEMSSNFLRGNCYWYARILQERFKPWFKTDIMYNQIDNHFCCRLEIDGREFYADASGLIEDRHGWELWEDHIKNEPLESARVYRDCIWHLNEDDWLSLPSTFRKNPWSFLSEE